MRLLLFLTAAMSVWAADWLSASADPKHTYSQPAETDLSRETIGDLKLLWKMRFDEPITAPLVLGPIFTHRGIKELVFFAGAGDNLYAVDADLARVFWKRHFDTKPGCSARLTATPVLAPYYGPAPEGDDASTPRRSLFVLTSDGDLHSVRPADAHDLAVPISFLPPGSIASDLNLTSSTVRTNVTGGCSKPELGEWSIRIDGSNSKPAVQWTPPVPKTAAAAGYRVSVLSSENGLAASLNGKPVWAVSDPAPVLTPVIANKLVFTVFGNSLAVFDLATGVRLYRSKANGSETATASLAVANGHVYFIAGQTIYCYGFPIEI